MVIDILVEVQVFKVLVNKKQ